MQCNILLFLFLTALLTGYYFFCKRWKGRFQGLPVSSARFFPKKRSFRLTVATLPEKCYWITAFLVIFALSDPRGTILFEKTGVKKGLPRKGIALYFLLDQSGSMDEKVSIFDETSNAIQIRKIDMAKKVISEFISGNSGLRLSGRENDLVGLVAFARTANVLSPLTLDRQQLQEKLFSIEPITQDRLNGTAIGYAIFKTVNMIVATKHFAERNSRYNQPVYAIDNQAIIVVTDGLQSPHPDDKNHQFRFIGLEEAINYAKTNAVRIYFIGVDPVFERREFGEEVGRLKEAVNSSGGAFFLATKALPIQEIFAKIDTLEKSELPPEMYEKKVTSLVPYVLWGALIVLLIGTLGETLFLRKIP